MTAEQTASPEVSADRGVRAAHNRYRVMAYVVGVMLLVLTLVAMPIKYIGHNDTPVAIVGVAHGILYAIFFLVTLDLAVQARWRPLSALLVVVAGTIPFLSFVAERTVTGRMRAGERV
jgi:integral membrane protein